MKKRRMRLLALLLSATMLVPPVPVGATAADVPVVQGTQQNEPEAKAVTYTEGWNQTEGGWIWAEKAEDSVQPKYLFKLEASDNNRPDVLDQWNAYEYKDGQPSADKMDTLPSAFQGYAAIGFVKDNEKVTPTYYFTAPDGKIKINSWVKTQNDKEEAIYCYFGSDGIQETSPESGRLGFQSEITYNDGTGDKFLKNIFIKDDFTLLTDAWKDIDGKKLYFNKDGVLEKRSGIQTIGEDKYYLGEDGTPIATGAEGVLIKDVKYITDENGKVVKEYKPVEEGWQFIEGRGWWYQYEDGTYPEFEWKDINGQRYYFGKYGYMKESEWYQEGYNWYYLKEGGAMAKGWFQVDGKWYYADDQGIMKTGWIQLNNIWFYCYPSGVMATGWEQIGGKWYYFNGSGGMATGWKKIGNTWYYLNASGAMATGWTKIGNVWFYLKSSGAMATGWLQIGKTWYYFKGDGGMVTGWFQVGKYWYYCWPSGAMATGWIEVNGIWYFLSSGGAMVSNQWVGNYYLTAGGGMAVNRWIGQKFVDENGKYVSDYKLANSTYETSGQWISNSGQWQFKYSNGKLAKNAWVRKSKIWYYLGADSNMVTGWKYIDGYKYYFNSTGGLVQDLRSRVKGPYMAKINRQRCCITIYAQDGGSGYTIPVISFVCSVGLPATPTPTGTFYTSQKQRWGVLMGPSYGQYCTRIVGGILFHSVAGYGTDSHSLPAAEYNRLGSPASHGCVRMTVRDAKWIFDNCPLGMKVQIYDNAIPGPYDKPVAQKIPASQNWDPTDPEA